jgi:hypothetical protein
MEHKNIKDDFHKERIERLVESFKDRGISSYFAKNKEDARNYILNLIPENSTIGFGGSVTVSEIGLRDELLNRNYRVFNQYEKGITKEESLTRRKYGITADFFITGSNAITEDGCIINIDGTGNRIAGISFGAETVFIIVGRNKITPDIETGIWRIMNITAPMNVRRLDIKDAPCFEDGYCSYCNSQSRICNQIHIIERSHSKDRINVVILNEDLGF